jgi:hypothetical protein
MIRWRSPTFNFTYMLVSLYVLLVLTIKILYFLQNLFMFRMIVTINSDCFPIQRSLIGISNGSALYSLQVGNQYNFSLKGSKLILCLHRLTSGPFLYSHDTEILSAKPFKREPLTLVDWKKFQCIWQAKQKPCCRYKVRWKYTAVPERQISKQLRKWEVIWSEVSKGNSDSKRTQITTSVTSFSMPQNIRNSCNNDRKPNTVPRVCFFL